ncbi:MerR family transcriptional regulator [Nonomuraea sp. NEAU-A123]|uniref:helix-turn-helix domain-containing protein n=1 Tax=Nonomuraea sp. NEAU-A123 TaxID=2839649 RepID=UPI0027E1E275|nr:MerR family transcriptional regulator [Nonomuraea sp. NEAU-A123]
MSDHVELYTIGELADRTGLPVRTIRFWSDSGILPPTGRTAGGYRLYDEAAAARLELVRMLRDLGIGLAAVKDVLSRQVTVAEVARVHLRAVDAEIRALRMRRAVLSVIAEQGGTTEETLMMHELARLSAAQRRQIVDEFVEGTFAGLDLDGDAAIVAEWMRELPNEPAPAQVGAWVELAGLTTGVGRRGGAGVGRGAADPRADRRRPTAGARVARLAGDRRRRPGRTLLGVDRHAQRPRERALRGARTPVADRRRARPWPTRRDEGTCLIRKAPG